MSESTYTSLNWSNPNIFFYGYRWSDTAHTVARYHSSGAWNVNLFSKQKLRPVATATTQHSLTEHLTNNSSIFFKVSATLIVAHCSEYSNISTRFSAYHFTALEVGGDIKLIEQAIFTKTMSNQLTKLPALTMAESVMVTWKGWLRKMLQVRMCLFPF